MVLSFPGVSPSARTEVDSEAKQRQQMFVREQVEEQLRRRILARVPLSENVTWLRSTDASVADAIELLEGVGLHRVEARFVLRADPSWRALIDDNTH